MCTCITFINRDFYFGRNLDLEYSFGEQLMITPRRYPFFWSREGKTQEHYAMIGMGAAEPLLSAVRGGSQRERPGYGRTEFSGERLLSAIPGEYEKRRVL